MNRTLISIIVILFMLTFAPTSNSAELELYHADFHGRIGMMFRVIINTVPSNYNMEVTLTPSGSSSTVIYTKPGPLARSEYFPFILRDLTAGDYTLAVHIKNGQSVVHHATRTFNKPYDGVPRIGIDENNAFRIDDQLFFPVMCKGINSETQFTFWQPYINTVKHVGFSTTYYSTVGFQTWLDRAQQHNYMAIGPGRGYYWPNGGAIAQYSGGQDRVALLDEMVKYMNVAKDHPAFMMYEWKDEPELDNSDNCVLPEEVVRWKEKGEEIDNQHLMFINTGGYGFARPVGNWLYNHIRTYTYKYGTYLGGEKKLIGHVISQDYYPIENEDDPNYVINIEKMCLAMDNMNDWNANLAPLIACVETCDINTNSTDAPTAAELRLIIWANIIHGAKAISWFQYFNPTPAENYAVMAEFKNQVTALTDAVLADDYSGVVTRQTQNGGRIDYMVKQTADAIYIFAANILTNAETATFTLDIPLAAIEAYDESRNITPVNQTFTDSFDPLEVHIYRIPTNNPRVVNQQLFYNNSSFDDNNPAVTPEDDDAVAPDKHALLAGNTASFANYTSYDKGINGLVIDCKGLNGPVTPADFTFQTGNETDHTNWSAAPAPTSITTRIGQGQEGSDRVTIIFPDNAIRKTWLKVTVNATSNTNLASPHVFFFGNAPGDTGDQPTASTVDATDEIEARINPRHFLKPATITNIHDFNRDGRVDATDQVIARNNSTTFANDLELITP